MIDFFAFKNKKTQNKELPKNREGKRNSNLETDFTSCVPFFIAPPLYTISMSKLKTKKQNPNQKNHQTSNSESKTKKIPPFFLYLNGSRASTGSLQGLTALEFRFMADSTVWNCRIQFKIIHKQHNISHNSSSSSSSPSPSSSFGLSNFLSVFLCILSLSLSLSSLLLLDFK